jgi:Cd2+/Zn2+-exporting ATPase
VTGAALLAFIPSVITGQWTVWIQRALIFLVISCPCALVIRKKVKCGITGCQRKYDSR